MQLLPLSHPLRQVLIPTEVGTRESMARAFVLLLPRGGLFELSDPLTFHGLDCMVREYKQWNPSDMEDKRTGMITGDIPMFDSIPVLGDYRRWWKHIYSHMVYVVRAMYPSGDVDDISTVAWVGKSTDVFNVLVVLLTDVFFTLVRHNIVSNVYSSNTWRWNIILLNTETIKLSRVLLLLAGSAGSTAPWIPLTERAFENIVQCERVHAALSEFYESLRPTSAFARSINHPAMLPSEIGMSVGI